MDAVITRLETVASRLEAAEGRLNGSKSDAAQTGFTPPKFGVALPGLASPGRQPLAAKPEARREAPTQAEPASSTRSLADWDALVGPAQDALLAAASDVGGEVLDASRAAEAAFKAERTVVQAIAQCQKPDQAGLSRLVAPVGAELQRVGSLAEGRRTPAFNHHKALAEALQGLTWVVYTGPACGMSPPEQHVQQAWQSAEFWANKVLMEFRGKDAAQVAWVKALQALLLRLKEFVARHHARGPAWNATGKPASAFAPSSAGPSAGTGTVSNGAVTKATGRAPPPPPPPAAGSLHQKKTPTAAAGASPAGLGAVFSQITAQGDGVTRGLRKVTDEMKSKAKADASGAISSSRPVVQAEPRAGTRGAKSSGPPRTECEQGRKWIVENHVGARDIVIADTSPKQSVYIYRCRDCTVQIKGKFNALIVDDCSKTGVVFESLVAACELVNCSSLQVQATGLAPTIAVDKCDGVQLYLSETSAATPVTTAKSSAVNLVVPGPGGGDMLELYIPEQFVSTVRNGRLVTEPVSHSGG